MKKKSGRTEIAELGEFGLIDRLMADQKPKNAATLIGWGDDAAAVAAGGDEAVVCTTDLLTEGVDFDLTYFPLRHLGYKAVTVGVSDVLAMNARPEQLLLSIGVSSKIPVEALEELYDGVKFACRELGIDFVGGDTRASVNGLTIHVTALGRVERNRAVCRSGARINDLICITRRNRPV